MSQISQQCLRLLDKNWRSFFASIKDWLEHKDKYTGKPKLPKCVNQYKLNTKIKGSLQQIRILPRNRHFVIEVVYNVVKPNKLIDNNKYTALDIGLNNLASIVNNCNIQPVIISGKKLKSINKYYNKLTSNYKEIAKRMNGLDYTERMNKLTIKRNNMVTDLLHKASKSVINYALSCETNTIIIGNNKDWKRNSSMSKEVNQSFVGIPHQQFIKMIQYKAENAGLNVVITEESYTSGTSFLDGEDPIKENYNKSRRVHRGLFKSNAGKFINADINGALQIMKKVFSNAFKGHEIEDYGFNPLRVGL